jgi:hypothetical protein
LGKSKNPLNMGSYGVKYFRDLESSKFYETGDA